MINYLLPILAYFMGSISSAVVVSKLMGLQDPRSVGSGNPGATNMLRVGGKKAAVITLLGDILKGVVPVVIARVFTTDPLILALVAFMAFLGHLFPLFFGFHGGKGVATAFGALVALSPWVGLALAVTWSVIAAMFRYSSLSAITTALLAPAYVWLLLPARPYFYVTLTMAALLLWRHRSNIRNLLTGTEGKIMH
jgi:glycerol-3-phosphate acyltransferase PlsY